MSASARQRLAHTPTHSHAHTPSRESLPLHARDEERSQSFMRCARSLAGVTWMQEKRRSVSTGTTSRIQPSIPSSLTWIASRRKELRSASDLTRRRCILLSKDRFTPRKLIE